MLSGWFIGLLRRQGIVRAILSNVVISTEAFALKQSDLAAELRLGDLPPRACLGAVNSFTMDEKCREGKGE